LLKKQLADKKKKLAAMKAKKAKDDKAKKAAAKKKKNAAKNKKSKSSVKVSANRASAKKEVETLSPEDEVAMKSYSQAIAQQAENNEPDAPVDYDGQAPAEKMTNKNDVDEDADKEITQLLLGVSKKGNGRGLIPGSELIQLNAEGLEGLFEDEDEQTAVQTGESDQTAPAEEAPAAEATVEVSAEAPPAEAPAAEAPAAEATAEAPAVEAPVAEAAAPSEAAEL
jgi:hypothetical protein